MKTSAPEIHRRYNKRKITVTSLKGIQFIGLDRPLGFQEGETLRISRRLEREGDNAVNLTHRPPLPPRISLVLVSVAG